jgi:7-cyano-7-deazaguanine synthase in queuosine biosynthesis
MLKSVTIDNLDIPFDPDWKKIAISVSGGADSALLTALLCDMIKYESTQPCEIHIIQHIRNWKTKPWQQYDAVRIFNYFINNYPDITFYKHNNFIPPEMEWADKGPTMTDEYGKQVSGDNIELRSFAEFICHSYDIPVYYNAVTRNPRDVDFKGMPTRDLDESKDNQHLKIMEHMGRIAIHPFRFVQKDWIVKQYKEQNKVDLFNHTRSCEGEAPGIDYTNYVPNQTVPECGECFWCKEREWAIEQNKE